MDYILRGHGFHHEVYTCIQLFFHNERYTLVETVSEAGLCVESVLEGTRLSAFVHRDKKTICSDSRDTFGMNEKQLKNAIKTTVFNCLSEITGRAVPWGILTGIRPTKKVLELKSGGMDNEEIQRYLEREYLVSPKKAAFCVETALNEQGLLEKAAEKDVSLYIGLPFCPTRCLYCSFTAYPIGGYAEKASLYIDCLIKELAYISGKINGRGERLSCIYIGGGTPTSIETALMEKLLLAMSGLFDIASADEFCCEAGRPDTITEVKLSVLRKYGVGRISINPQTLKQETLDRIGRAHSVGQFFEAYQLARAAGFGSVNIDLIAGLPGETTDDFESSLKGMLALEPDNLTVHTLCVKRASGLREELDMHSFAKDSEIGAMLDICYEMCKNKGLIPYYMYRQKNALGNYENTGYCAAGKECAYNVMIMEEKQTIYAAGAGSVTKLYYPADDRVERAFNVKDVDEYLLRTDEMIARKDVLL